MNSYRQNSNYLQGNMCIGRLEKISWRNTSYFLKFLFKIARYDFKIIFNIFFH